VYDDKACFFGIPFHSLTDNEAIRSFADAVRDPQTRLALHPDDYTLYHVGVFDDNAGVIEPVKPAYLSRASEHVPVIGGPK
jgi:hypothetical protein